MASSPHPPPPNGRPKRIQKQVDALSTGMPQNVEAERSLLGAALLDNKALAAMGEKIEPTDFFHDHHRRIYVAMLEMENDGLPVDLITLTEYLQQKQELERIGGAAYISLLMDGVPHISNVSYYAQIVRQKSVQRALVHSATSIQQQALLGEDDLQTLLARAEKSMCRVLEFDKREPVPALTTGGAPKFSSFALSDFMAQDFPAKDHLIEYLTPRGGRAMIVALPHRLKSWATTGLALASTVSGIAFGKLRVDKPVFTYLVQLEEWPGQLKERIATLLLKDQFKGCNPQNMRILPRCELDLTNDAHFNWFLQELRSYKPDHVILDVLRKFFSGDVNSPKETAEFLKRLDFVQTVTGCALTLVHHENRKKEEAILAAAGSYNWGGWAEVMIHFSRKTEARTDHGPITSVEVDIDTKAGPPADTMRLTLDTSLPHPLRLENAEDGTGFSESMKMLGGEWTVDNLANVTDLHRKTAWKYIQKWERDGKIEKVKSGKRGRGGGLALFRSLDPADHDL